MRFRRHYKLNHDSIHPNEIFLDSSNLPHFDKQQFEGRIEQPISKKLMLALGGLFLLTGVIFLGRLSYIQIFQGGYYRERSDLNKLRYITVYPERGTIYDRNEVPLAFNGNGRQYIEKEGFGHILGYLGLPHAEDIKKFDYERDQFIGKDGAEEQFDSKLAGESGLRVEEVNAKGEIASDHVLNTPVSGDNMHLAIDAVVQEKFFEYLKQVIGEGKYQGGAGVIMDVHTGEVLAMVSFPEYDPNVLSKPNEGINKNVINEYYQDKNNPFLNRVVSGLYTPGSIVKPIMALGALSEKTISPSKVIVTNGKLVVPNPYYPDKPSVFLDWQNNGALDMRKAIAMSGDVYFYYLGGGFGGQKGLGIYNIDKYTQMFGFGEKTGIDLRGESKGVVPSPEWKKQKFNGEEWVLGNTYHTVIGQYGFLTSPVQIVKAMAALSTNGLMVTPTILRADSKSKPKTRQINLDTADFKVVQEGMRQAVTDGTAVRLNIPGIEVAAKTGSAELGVGKLYINSWITGYWPYQNPRYAFAVVMERGSTSGTVGSVVVMQRLLEWLKVYKSEYLNDRVI